MRKHWFYNCTIVILTRQLLIHYIKRTIILMYLIEKHISMGFHIINHRFKYTRMYIHFFFFNIKTINVRIISVIFYAIHIESSFWLKALKHISPVDFLFLLFFSFFDSHNSIEINFLEISFNAHY